MWGARQPARRRPWWQRGRVRLIVATAAVVSSLGLMSARCPAASAAADPIGAHSMLQLDDPYSFMQAMFSEAADMHASAIRLDVAPALVFGGPSEAPDFSGLDEVMALSEQYHLRVVADLLTIPWWLADCQAPSDMLAMTRCGTDDLTGYGSVIAQIVAHADPVIRDWEIWNEPDNDEFFTGTPQQYAHMLRTAHDTIKGIDPGANVLLGGISGTGGMAWLTRVFATPGADAAHAFDTANVHERGWLDGLTPDITSWRRLLAGYGFTGALWVTEHGYPSDPAFQYDPSYASGPVSQAAYLSASIPSLLDAGASEVFVTERDNLGGQFGSEGVLGGDVSDPPVDDPQVLEKPAFAAVRTIADCYTKLGHDCPGRAPAAFPARLTITPTRPGFTNTSSVLIADPGPGPLELGRAAVLPGARAPITIANDGCADRILEPNETCAASLRFAPSSGGNVAAVLVVPSDSGRLIVPVTAVSPSVASLASRQLPNPAFTPTDGADGVGHTQRLVLELDNPLSAKLHLAGSTLRGADARRFRVRSNRCVHTTLRPGGRCRLSILFRPARAGTAHAALSLRGDGEPLSIRLRPTAYALPSVIALQPADHCECVASPSGRRIGIVTNEPALLRWRVVAAAPASGRLCDRVAATPAPVSAGRSVLASGRASTAGRRSVMRPGGRWSLLGTGRRYPGSVGLPTTGPRHLQPGRYALTVEAVNGHGTGPSKTMWLTVVS